jgi:hypothetical protein
MIAARSSPTAVRTSPAFVHAPPNLWPALLHLLLRVLLHLLPLLLHLLRQLLHLRLLLLRRRPLRLLLRGGGGQRVQRQVVRGEHARPAALAARGVLAGRRARLRTHVALRTARGGYERRR